MRVVYVVGGWIALLLAGGGFDVFIIGLWQREPLFAAIGAASSIVFLLVAAFCGRRVGWAFLGSASGESGRPRQHSGG